MDRVTLMLVGQHLSLHDLSQARRVSRAWGEYVGESLRLKIRALTWSAWVYYTLDPVPSFLFWHLDIHPSLERRCLKRRYTQPDRGEIYLAYRSGAGSEIASVITGSAHPFLHLQPVDEAVFIIAAVSGDQAGPGRTLLPTRPTVQTCTRPTGKRLKLPLPNNCEVWLQGESHSQPHRRLNGPSEHSKGHER